MRTRATLLLLALLLACSKDTLLFEQVALDTHGVILTDNCADIDGYMISESSAVVYAGAQSLFTNDDFKTISFQEYTGTISCQKSVLYFDGNTAWIENDTYCSRESFQGKPYYKIDAGYPGYGITPTLPLGNVLTLFPPYFVNDNESITAGRSGSVIYVYRAKTTTEIAAQIGSTASQADWWNPSRMFRAGNLYLMTARMDGFGTRPVSVFTSPDLVNWQGPYAFDVLASSASIVEISGSTSLLIARVVDNLSTSPLPAFKMSIDEGSTWTPLGTGKNFSRVQVLDNQTVFAIAFVSDGDRGPVCKLSKSTDAGATWVEETASFYGERFHFYDADNGIAMANGTLQVTNDGGKTWQLVLVTPN